MNNGNNHNYLKFVSTFEEAFPNYVFYIFSYSLLERAEEDLWIVEKEAKGWPWKDIV